MDGLCGNGGATPASAPRRAGVATGSLAIWLVGTAALGWAADGLGTPGGWDRRPLEDSVALLAAVAAWLLLTWHVLALVLFCLPGGRSPARWAGRLAPRPALRLATVLLGVSVTALPGLPAGAAPVTAAAAGAPAAAGDAPSVGPSGPHRGRSPRPVVPPVAVDRPLGSWSAGSWVPGRPTAPRPALGADCAHLVSRAPRAELASDGTVTVRAGDTLWDIAARHLGAGAAPTAVAAEWPRWYAANRAVLGDDPDHIRPGQILHAPSS